MPPLQEPFKNLDVVRLTREYTDASAVHLSIEGQESDAPIPPLPAGSVGTIMMVYSAGLHGLAEAYCVEFAEPPVLIDVPRDALELAPRA